MHRNILGFYCDFDGGYDSWNRRKLKFPFLHRFDFVAINLHNLVFELKVVSINSRYMFTC